MANRPSLLAHLRLLCWMAQNPMIDTSHWESVIVLIPAGLVLGLVWVDLPLWKAILTALAFAALNQLSERRGAEAEKLRRLVDRLDESLEQAIDREQALTQKTAS